MSPWPRRACKVYSQWLAKRPGLPTRRLHPSCFHFRTRDKGNLTVCPESFALRRNGNLALEDLGRLSKLNREEAVKKSKWLPIFISSFEIFLPCLSPPRWLSVKQKPCLVSICLWGHGTELQMLEYSSIQKRKTYGFRILLLFCLT